jgi:HNH endonuclease
MLSRPDRLCLEALARGLIRVDVQAGRAWSMRFWGRELGCTNKGGYKVFTLHVAGERAQIKIHRLIWLAANGEIPAGLVPDHENRIKSDNRIANLRLLTAAGNSRNRRSYAGCENPAAKLDIGIADQIRLDHQTLKSYRLVAYKHNVSRSLVAQIVRRELWA